MAFKLAIKLPHKLLSSLWGKNDKSKWVRSASQLNSIFNTVGIDLGLSKLFQLIGFWIGFGVLTWIKNARLTD